jgi:uncharacterized protein YjdB
MKAHSLFKRLTSCGFSIALILGIITILIISTQVRAEKDIVENVEKQCDQLYDKFIKKNNACIDECDLKKKAKYYNTLIGLQNQMDALGCEEVESLIYMCGSLADLSDIYYVIDPPSPNHISVGETVKLTATFNGPPCITKSKGEELEGEVSGSQTWYSDDKRIATVDQGGLVRGENPGIVMIRVMSDDMIIPGVVDLQGVAQVNVDCDLEGAYIDVSKTDLEIDVGESEFISAIPVGPICLTEDLEWESIDESVATVDQNGNITGVGQGITQIFVRHKTFKDIESEIIVNVRPRENAIEIQPTMAEIDVGETIFLLVRVTDKDGNVIPDAKVDWEIPAQDFISFDPINQLVTGLKEGGPVELTAEYETVFATAVIFVGPQECSSIQIQPNSAKILIDESKTLEVTVKDKHGNIIQDPFIDWTIPSGGIISFDPINYIVTGSDVGTATITATCGAASDSTIITVIGNNQQYHLEWHLYRIIDYNLDEPGSEYRKFWYSGDMTLEFEYIAYWDQFYLKDYNVNKITYNAEENLMFDCNTNWTEVSEGMRVPQLDPYIDRDPSGGWLYTFNLVRLYYPEYYYTYQSLVGDTCVIENEIRQNTGGDSLLCTPDGVPKHFYPYCSEFVDIQSDDPTRFTFDSTVVENASPGLSTSVWSITLERVP